jgi:FAD/FMN-containing dehydrogenase
VIKVHHEHEVVQLLQLAQRHHVPVTFRAAGTSLSGQAITDSILIKVGSRHTHTGGGGCGGFGGGKARRHHHVTIQGRRDKPVRPPLTAYSTR